MFMGRDKKPKKPNKNEQDAPKGIRFELEEDAEKLLLDHLAAFKPSSKDSDEESEPEPSVVRSRKMPQREYRIDLHGLHLEEAMAIVREKIDVWLLDGQPFKVKIITGKGKHSEGGRGILSQEIHRYVLQRYPRDIQDIEESPHQVRLWGMPLRGHFNVSFRARTGRKKADRS